MCPRHDQFAWIPAPHTSAVVVLVQTTQKHIHLMMQLPFSTIPAFKANRTLTFVYRIKHSIRPWCNGWETLSLYIKTNRSISIPRIYTFTGPKADCDACAMRSQCTTGTKIGRQLALRPRAQFEALQAMRMQQDTEEFKRKYAPRAGIEGTISEAVRMNELRRSRYRGEEKTHLQHVLLAVALNFGRLDLW
jgi:hypothetical protein